MKTILTAVVLLAATWAQATLTLNTTLPVNLPDGNPVGVTSVGTVSGVAGTVGSVNVTLNVSGGYNGNLYAYLMAPNGTLVVLLNRPGQTDGSTFGFGYAGSGLNVTLTDAMTLGGNPVTGIQTTTETPGQIVSGTYNAAGTLGAFNNSSANGNWALFFADMVAGGGQAQLTGWSLDITAVPEPVTLALGCFVAMLLALAGLRWAWRT